MLAMDKELAYTTATVIITSIPGIFGFFAANEVKKGGGREVAVIAGAMLSMFLFKLADWIRVPRLKEWALGIAMFGATLDYQYNWGAVGMWLIFIFLISTIASIMPANTATRISVRDSLAYA